MKKAILLLISGLACITGISQIPNGGFETWNNMGPYENPASWGTMNNTTAALSIFTATKATPGNPGSFYLRLTSKTIGPGVVNGIAVCGKLDSLTMLPKSGIPYTTRPQSFTGRWQHMIYGTSQGSLSVTLTRWNTTTNMRETVATANQTLSGMAMSWANFTINFVYQNGSAPDTAIIFLKASGTVPTNNDYLWVDNLAFTGIVAGTEELTSLNAISVFPNPVSHNLIVAINSTTEQETVIEIADLTGKVILKKDLGQIKGNSESHIDISTLPAGTYLVSIITATGSETKKIIIE